MCTARGSVTCPSVGEAKHAGPDEHNDIQAPFCVLLRPLSVREQEAVARSCCLSDLECSRLFQHLLGCISCVLHRCHFPQDLGCLPAQGSKLSQLFALRGTAPLAVDALQQLIFSESIIPDTCHAG